jgi:hypothetical protein
LWRQFRSKIRGHKLEAASCRRKRMGGSIGHNSHPRLVLVACCYVYIGVLQCIAHILINLQIDAILLLRKKQSQDHAPTREVPNYYSPKTAEENTTYWELTPGDEFINCHIHNNPIGAQSTSNKNRDRRTLKDTDKEQYVIHIHGLVRPSSHSITSYCAQP